MAIDNRRELPTAEFAIGNEYVGDHVTIDVYNPEMVRLIRSHLRTDALGAMETGDPELAEDIIHLFNEMTRALDSLVVKTTSDEEKESKGGAPA